MVIHFTKLNALGNDFALIDGRTCPWTASTPQIIRMADRRMGVGFDQLIYIDPTSTDATVKVSFWNANGSRAQACGNGCRAVGFWWAQQTGQTQIRLTVDDQELPVSVASPTQVRVTFPQPLPSAEVVVMGQVARFIQVPNPHLVFVDTLQRAEALESLAFQQAVAELYPDGVNQNFVRLRGPGHIQLETIERGVGPTLACGTGAIAAACVAAEQTSSSMWRVDMPGGSVQVIFDGAGVALEGAAHINYTGAIEVP